MSETLLRIRMGAVGGLAACGAVNVMVVTPTMPLALRLILGVPILFFAVIYAIASGGSKKTGSQ